MQEISAEEKRLALARVLESRALEKSGRARDLLSYIVEQNLAGEAENIKGFTIAMDVFDKGETFDAVGDPLVRVQAGRLRDYLKEYYADDGADDPVIISVPLGAYRPEFMRWEDGSLPQMLKIQQQAIRCLATNWGSCGRGTGQRLYI